MSTHTRYRYWRAQGLPAKAALEYAREEERQRAVLARFGAWDFDPNVVDYGTFAYADLDGMSPIVRVMVGDDDMPDEGIDWTGASDEEIASVNEHRSTYYIAVVVVDEETGEELYHDGIGGVDVIDLPGYPQRDWEDAAAYALLNYLLDGALDFARRYTHRNYAGSRGEAIA